jgi:hypothetical protein
VFILWTGHVIPYTDITVHATEGELIVTTTETIDELTLVLYQKEYHFAHIGRFLHGLDKLLLDDNMI